MRGSREAEGLRWENGKRGPAGRTSSEIRRPEPFTRVSTPGRDLLQAGQTPR